MKLDNIALAVIVIVCGAFAVFYVGMIVFTASALSPWVLVGFVAVAIPIAYILVRVLGDRLRNEEDDYYERNIDQ